MQRKKGKKEKKEKKKKTVDASLYIL